MKVIPSHPRTKWHQPLHFFSLEAMDPRLATVICKYWYKTYLHNTALNAVLHDKFDSLYRSPLTKSMNTIHSLC